MKTFNILTHPVLLIVSFLFILISGEHMGGFYLMYLLIALPHGSSHALLGLIGVLLLVISYTRYKRAYSPFIGPVLNILGVCCLVLSLAIFFYKDKQGYNDGTFEQLVPQITLTIFGLLSLLFIISNVVRPSKKEPVQGNLSFK
ncbi:MAG: hypothetical protein ABI675_14365 [Chitinophagaceae bacterium]